MSLNIGKAALALGALLAWKNKDKIGEMLRGKTDPNDPSAGGGILDTLASGGGLQDILDKFRNSGSGREADSWVGTGVNEPIRPHQVESAIDEETMGELVRQTGLTREELIDRLTRVLPEAVNELTPDGHLPTAPQPGGNLLDDVPATGRSAKV